MSGLETGRMDVHDFHTASFALAPGSAEPETQKGDGEACCVEVVHFDAAGFGPGRRAILNLKGGN